MEEGSLHERFTPVCCQGGRNGQRYTGASMLRSLSHQRYFSFVHTQSMIKKEEKSAPTQTERPTQARRQ
jgi:hypothetical protein